jgi:hypothetical protein
MMGHSDYYQYLIQIKREHLMEFNKLTWISPTGGAAAVGADLSRPPPIYRPAGLPEYFVKIHNRPLQVRCAPTETSQ